MKRIPNWLIIIIVLGLLIASKFVFFAKKVEKPAAAAKGANTMPVAVNYYVVEPTVFSNNVYTTGKVGAFNEIELIPEVNGRINTIYFKEGETVNKGALLLKLNDADLQAQLLKTRNQLRLSEQKLERLKKLLAISGIS